MAFDQWHFEPYAIERVKPERGVVVVIVIELTIAARIRWP